MYASGVCQRMISGTRLSRLWAALDRTRNARRAMN
jgi:hypothetical protein